MTHGVFRLVGTCNNYPWSKQGEKSLAAQDKDTLLGAKTIAQFGSQLPFLPKILPIAKALPLQIHPSKDLAAKLYEKDPDSFTDPNHKPEIAIGLTKFEVFAGFKPLSGIEPLFKLPILVRGLKRLQKGWLVSRDGEALQNIVELENAGPLCGRIDEGINDNPKPNENSARPVYQVSQQAGRFTWMNSIEITEFLAISEPAIHVEFHVPASQEMDLETRRVPICVIKLHQRSACHTGLGSVTRGRCDAADQLYNLVGVDIKLV
ncbi:RmlC-like cupin domain-containing protein [Lasiosphaeria miniovina]|uniref:RmlC-like cupin domain-containing protein n=1 Tax=Lasiosphaeria miniovina TaxID=1954250 RepID=A0AA40DVN5_9PEZI|nr:RmlC-like cupin domain-containing protein [Lasiosphaeria miniovina]KAK0718054.1 RmlC-like cupin domain-containing protein [Lasiosphaeria miniovina]